MLKQLRRAELNIPALTIAAVGKIRKLDLVRVEDVLKVWRWGQVNVSIENLCGVDVVEKEVERSSGGTRSQPRAIVPISIRPPSQSNCPSNAKKLGNSVSVAAIPVRSGSTKPAVYEIEFKAEDFLANFYARIARKTSTSIFSSARQAKLELSLGTPAAQQEI